MITEIGNKSCIRCSYAKISCNEDLDIVEVKYEPATSPMCHYCEHCYDNIEKNG